MLKEIHDDIDRATLEAYGWQDLIPDLVGRPGATTPSPHKSPGQEAAEETLLSRLVELNQQRALEEKQGRVRWLRPDYQIPKLRHKVKIESREQFEADIALPDVTELPKWPSDGLEQIRIMRDLLAKAQSPLSAEALSTHFAGRNTAKRKDRVEQVLETLVTTGVVQMADGAGYFVPKQ